MLKSPQLRHFSTESESTFAFSLTGACIPYTLVVTSHAMLSRYAVTFATGHSMLCTIMECCATIVETPVQMKHISQDDLLIH